MKTIELSRYLLDEDAAEDYLRSNNVLKTFDECPACKSGHLGRIRRQRYLCYECRYEWNIRKDSKLESTHMPLSSFIGMMKMFADGMTASQCAYELGVSLMLTKRMFKNFQEEIIGAVPNVKEEGTIFVHLKYENDQISLSIKDKPDYQYSNIRLNRTRGEDRQFYYELSYDSSKAKNILNPINRISELDLFYRFASERIKMFRGRNILGLYSALLELAFRYNHRKGNFYKFVLTKFDINGGFSKISLKTHKKRRPI